MNSSQNGSMNLEMTGLFQATTKLNEIKPGARERREPARNLKDEIMEDTLIANKTFKYCHRLRFLNCK